MRIASKNIEIVNADSTEFAWKTITSNSSLWENCVGIMRKAEDSEFGGPAWEEIGAQLRAIHGCWLPRVDWDAIAMMTF